MCNVRGLFIAYCTCTVYKSEPRVKSDALDRVTMSRPPGCSIGFAGAHRSYPRRAQAIQTCYPSCAAIFPGGGNEAMDRLAVCPCGRNYGGSAPIRIAVRSASVKFRFLPGSSSSESRISEDRRRSPAADERYSSPSHRPASQENPALEAGDSRLLDSRGKGRQKRSAALRRYEVSRSFRPHPQRISPRFVHARCPHRSGCRSLRSQSEGVLYRGLDPSERAARGDVARAYARS